MIESLQEDPNQNWHGMSAKEREKHKLDKIRTLTYSATLEITKSGYTPIEYIEIDADSFEKIKNDKEHGYIFYNAFRFMWMSQYMLSIKETDLELKELMEQTDMQKSFWNNSLMEQLNEEWDEISTQSPMRDRLIKPQGLRKLKKLKSIKD